MHDLVITGAKRGEAGAMARPKMPWIVVIGPHVGGATTPETQTHLAPVDKPSLGELFAATQASSSVV